MGGKIGQFGNGAIRLYTNSRFFGNQYIKIIGDSARLGTVLKVAGRGFAAISIAADVNNPNLSFERKVVNSTFNLMSVAPNPYVASAGITLNIINVIAGDEIGNGIGEVYRWGKYYNANPYALMRDIGY